MAASPGPAALHAPAARNALSVFFLSGLLMAFPGAILPGWGYHLRDDFIEAGEHFLALAAGLLLSARLQSYLHARRSVRFVVVLGAGLGCAGFLWLAVATPPVHYLWRVAGVFWLGMAAGLLNGAAFQSMSVVFERDPAATVNLAGVLFGLGCLVLALLVAGTFYIYTLGSTLILLCLIPGFAAGLYARASFTPPVTHHDKDWREVWKEVRSPGAVLFTLLLFFQSGSEWSIACWLPIFVVHRIGASPAGALGMLAGYWLALLVGRVIAQALLRHASHGKILGASALAALFGCLILTFTNNRFGAWTGLLLVGGGFAAIYPLVVERIGYRFPEYHPGFYNGLLSIGFAGGLLMPWVFSYLAGMWGIQWVMAGPFLGTCMVVLLILLIWIEAKLTGTRAARVS